MSATPQESWVALLEDNRLAEIMCDRPDQDRLLGDIFLGRVDAVLPGIQAAFVDIGAEKAGFLHVSDLDHGDDDDDDDGNGNGNADGNGRGRGGRRSRKLPPIQDHLKKGQEILVSSLLKELTESVGDLRFGKAREVELTGISERQRLYRVEWE